MADEITIQDLRNTGFKSIDEAWDAYCEVTENYLGMGADPQRIVHNRRFVNWIKKMAASICEDCCDDSGLGEEDGNEF